jgi:hypothetical protein
MKAGMTDSGSATADTNVARQSRRNSHTTSTASSAPSYSRCMEPSYSSCTGCHKVEGLGQLQVRGAARSSASAAFTAAPTSTSLAPLLRATSKPTTGLPLSSASGAGLGHGVGHGGHLVQPQMAAIGRASSGPPAPAPSAPWPACARVARCRPGRCGRRRFRSAPGAAGARHRPPWRPAPAA